MANDLRDAEYTPALSFSKKSVTRSGCHFPGHSVISDILPRMRSESKIGRKNRPESEGDGERPEKKVEGGQDIDYDQQIRAPRMSSINQYTYGVGERHGSDAFSIAEGGSKSTSGSSAGSSEEKAKAPYFPAKFDLSQSTRRPSGPSEERSGQNSTILSYTTNNYMYEREKRSRCHLDSFGQAAAVFPGKIPGRQPGEIGDMGSRRQSLQRALRNFDENTTSDEQVEEIQRSKSSILPAGYRTSPGALGALSPLSNREGTELQQVYEPKKPLFVPAVLRPENSPSTYASSDAVTSPLGGSSPSLNFTFPEAGDSRNENSDHKLHDPQEPTHKHWKPNSFAPRCMSCLSLFGNIFTPQRKRRHHCRFCGSIFCYECLWRGEPLLENQLPTSPRPPRGPEGIKGSLLDARARFVIPVYSKLTDQADKSRLKQSFKNCKVCKDCGRNYHSIVAGVNSETGPLIPERSLATLTLPYIFIENPYLSAASVSTGTTNIQASTNEYLTDSRKESGVSAAPQDWTWSSF
ncbi:Piso0_000420 [Millerozyma farinosa CBS 7064]|uniref:Piso0_000420 protein n=1 Tax=Pichia sorbitophila (strain ATCC MYA-4447 / BCRC 22081 / CBS 7064 / NBRC 10061 / NRRL Y-12695) TaxID=559304 RepID=G8YTY5_PICSO|nr:Piso0_000420 [Millerozyma farinosa CBS 7064]CCE73386.1 Piso0_000420 [Millerozyma farinosa CBS 7064]